MIKEGFESAIQIWTGAAVGSSNYFNYVPEYLRAGSGFEIQDESSSRTELALNRV